MLHQGFDPTVTGNGHRLRACTLRQETGDSCYAYELAGVNVPMDAGIQDDARLKPGVILKNCLGFEGVDELGSIGDAHAGDIVPSRSNGEAAIGTEGDEIGRVFIERVIPQGALEDGGVFKRLGKRCLLLSEVSASHSQQVALSPGNQDGEPT